MCTMKSVILLRAGNWLLLGLALVGLSAFAVGAKRRSGTTASSAA